MNEYLPELSLWKERWIDKKNLLTPNSLNTQSVNIHACVCFAQLPFVTKKRKLWQTLLPLKVSPTIANIHTQVEIQLVIITFAIFLVFFSWEDVGVSDTQMFVIDKRKFHCFYMETLGAILPPLMSLTFTKSAYKKWSPNLAWNIKLERV